MLLIELTNVWMIQELHYSDFPEELQQQKGKKGVRLNMCRITEKAVTLSVNSLIRKLNRRNEVPTDYQVPRSVSI